MCYNLFVVNLWNCNQPITLGLSWLAVLSIDFQRFHTFKSIYSETLSIFQKYRR